jgi:hypothetical protein
VIGRKVFNLVSRLETEINEMILDRLTEVKASPIDASLLMTGLMSDIQDLIRSRLVVPLENAGSELWSTSDTNELLRILSSSIESGLKTARSKSATFAGREYATNVLGDTATFSNQQTLRIRWRNFSVAFEAAIADWILSNVLDPVNRQEDVDAVIGRAAQAFRDDVSPYRVRGLQPASRAALLGAGETILVASLGVAAVAAVYKTDTQEELVAQSVAIHDAKTGDDSFEAELLTEDWVSYPDPYFTITENRRRPNDRCDDVVVPKSLVDEVEEENE